MIRAFTFVFAFFICTITALAQPDAETRAKRDALERDALAAFASGDLDKSESLLRAWIKLRPMEFVPVYNLACVLATRGQIEPAGNELLKAVELGFTDRRTIETDANLEKLRPSKVYQDLLASWPKVLDTVIAAREERAKKGFSKKYTFERDAELRLSFASGFEHAAFAAAREEVKRLAHWWETQVLPERTPGIVPDGDSPDPWVMVILPTETDFKMWANRNFPKRGAATSYIGGVYDNDKKELVAQDLGATFKHEFMHVLHWRHNGRIGQVHPIWVQEGLCSLVEDTRVEKVEGGEDRIVPTPSWRTNSLKRRSSGLSISSMIKMPREKFASATPLANYALARAAFLYLSDQSKLRAWYAAYCDGFAKDATGKEAFEKTLGKPMTQIDKDFRAWLMKLPDGPELGAPKEDDAGK